MHEIVVYSINPFWSGTALIHYISKQTYLNALDAYDLIIITVHPAEKELQAPRVFITYL